jgi:hypothetical protein
MKRALPVVILAAALLPACQSNPPPQQVAVQPSVMAYQPGTGVVQRVFPTPASANLNRLEVKMDNGTVQYIDTDSRDFQRGTRIALSENREIRKQ